MRKKSSKASSTRVITIVGKIGNEIKPLPLICVRKNCIRKHGIPEEKIIKSGKKEVLGMISHPGMSKSQTAKYVHAWCHPFRQPDEFLDRKIPRLLLSESDFVDPGYIPVYTRRSQPKWDFFYFTIGGGKGVSFKGLDLFLSIFPSIAKRGLKCLVVNYIKKPLALSREGKKIWTSCSPNISYIHRKLSPGRVARIMAASRFGMFANTRDCSPLLLTESLVRNAPIFVNRDIIGGWKYVNDNTGQFFTKDTIEDDLDKLLDVSYSPKDAFLSEFGFKQSALRLAEFGRKHLKSFRNCEMACFSGLSNLLKKYM